MTKNVCIVSSHLGIGGGAEKSAVTLGESLLQKGHNIKYFTMYGSTEKHPVLGEEFSLEESITRHPIKLLSKLVGRAYQISEFCKRHGIDVVISHRESCNFSSVLSQLFGHRAKIILSVRSNIRRSKSDLYKLFIRGLYPFSDGIVTIVRSEAMDLIRDYGVAEKKVTSIHNMIDVPNIRKRSQEEIPEFARIFENGKYTFINVGRMDEQKNQKSLLIAFDLFHKNHPNSQLVIIGNGLLGHDGSKRKELERMRETLSSKENIHFLGFQENPYKFMARSDAFVLSSEWEGMPRVLLEALACGLPVISTDCPTGPREILRESEEDTGEIHEVKEETFGLLVPTGNPESMANAMTLLYTNAQVHETYKIRSQERVECFNIPSILAQWEEILEGKKFTHTPSGV